MGYRIELCPSAKILQDAILAKYPDLEYVMKSLANNHLAYVQSICGTVHPGNAQRRAIELAEDSLARALRSIADEYLKETEEGQSNG